MPRVSNFIWPNKYECRYNKVQVRAEGATSGKVYLIGRAAPYNVLTRLWGNVWERIMPGAFTRALREKQDVRHLVNHDPTLVLGRTKSGTTVLSEDDKGLNFRTLINAEDPAALSLVSKVERGDVDENSFGFIAVRQAWLSEPDPENDKDTREIRELHDVDLLDVSTVTYPQYSGTSTSLSERSKSLMLFPATQGRPPAEIRRRLGVRPMAPGVPNCAIPIMSEETRQFLSDMQVEAEQAERCRWREWGEAHLRAALRPLGF